MKNCTSLRSVAAVFAVSLVCLISPGKSVKAVRAESVHIAVYGDSFATGIFFGLRGILPGRLGVVVSRRSRGGTGLVRNDEYDWIRRAGRYAHTDRPDIVVVSLGGNDRQDLQVSNLRIKRFSNLWWKEYVQRAKTVMLDLRASGSSVYWVGIPIVRSERLMRDYRKLNGLFRELTRLYGIHYIDLGTHFLGPDRRYTPFETISGHQRRIRHPDGIHFTSLGNQRFAQVVESALRHRLASKR